MEQPPKIKPKLKEFIWENWGDWKDKSVKDITRELADVCDMPTGNAMTSFKFAFNNKKKNERSREKKHQDLDESQTSNSTSTKTDLSNQIYIQQIDTLRKHICSGDKEAKRAYLQEQIDKNPFFIIKFMEKRMINLPVDFLEIMVQICYDLKENHQLQTKLFVRICAIHFDEMLNINEGLLQLALNELSNIQNDQNAAYGFLKLAYQNDIALVNFPSDLLTSFQYRYSMVFGRFYNFLSQDIAPQVLGCLPATCFLFTEPFYEVLKKGGDKLHHYITPDYLPFFIDLLAYSFENDFDAFANFLKLFKEGCMLLSGLQINIIPLIAAIHQEEQNQIPRFFKTLKNTHEIFEHVFNMIKEGKLTTIDQKFATQIINLTDQELREQRLRPKQLKSNSENEAILKQYIQKFSKMNQSLSGFMVKFPNAQNESYNNILELFQLSQMNQVQMISSYIMENLFEVKKLFQQFETGIGKTTLSLIFMLYACQNYKKKCISIYKQEGLCYRDYKRLQGIASGMPLSILYLSSDDQSSSIQKSDIVFVSDSMYQTLCKSKDFENFLKESLTIMDEFDSILFDEKKPVDELLNYNKSNHLIGFTGSNLTSQHQKILTLLFDSTFLQFPLAQNIDGSINNCREQIAYSKRSEQLNHLSSICQQQSKLTPVLLILDKAGRRQFKDSNKKMLTIVDLTKKSSIQIESHLKNSFLLKNVDAYQVCLISKSQGRGIDVRTNAEIEANGGVAVIIADTPINQRELDQLKGRTKRMQNKGQYFVILWNNLSLMNESFLQEQMDMAAQKEDLYLNDLSLKLQKITESQAQSEEQRALNKNARVLEEEKTPIKKCSNQGSKHSSFQSYLYGIEINDQIESNVKEQKMIDAEKRQKKAIPFIAKEIIKDLKIGSSKKREIKSANKSKQKEKKIKNIVKQKKFELN